MLLFKQLELFTRIAGEAVSFPLLFGVKRGELTASVTICGRDAELESKAREILAGVGAPKLAEVVRVEWSPRLRTAAGRAHFHDRLVSLNPRLREHGEAETDRTLRHELAHLLAHARTGRRRIAPHGTEWRQACSDLGLAGEARCHSLPFPTQARARRLLYRCPKCTLDFPRVRRIRRAVACLACCRRYNRGRFDPLFRLRLVRQRPAAYNSTVSRVKTSTHAKLLLLLGLTLLGVVQQSFAYVAKGSRWTLDRHVLMHLSLGAPRPLQDGFASFNQSAADALNIWNLYLAHLKLVPQPASSLPPGNGDSDNSVFFSRTMYGEAFGDRTLAITLISTRGTVITETDVLFNSAFTWNSYRGVLQAGVEDFHRVALHEFGHVLGLDHPDDSGQKVIAIMNSIITNIDSLRQDDISGAQSLYTNGPAYLNSVTSANLVNLSTRAFVGTGDNVLIGGFIIQGSQPSTVVLRAIGHSLAARGVASPLTDPQVELRNSNGTLLVQNDDWIDGPNAETISSYGLDPSNSRESALLRALNPGNYTAIVKAFNNGDGDLTGTGLIELYDLHTTGGRAGNISTRGQVLTGDDAMIAGFIVGGSQPKEVVIRGLGPALASRGIANALPDPAIEVYDAAGNLILANDDWEADANAGRVRDAGLAPSEVREAALYANLRPGSYTTVMRGFNNSTGIGLIEVYDLSPAP